MITGCLFAIVCALFITVIIAILRENHDLRKTIGKIEISRQKLMIQIRIDEETIARGEVLNQSLKARIFELKEKLSEKENQ